MAVQVKAAEFGNASVMGGNPAVLDRHNRIQLYARRRRLARVKEVGSLALWFGISATLCLVAAGGLFSIR